MAVALIDIMVTRERIKHEVVSDHYWYDQTKKHLIKVTGGSLAFKYTGRELHVTTEPLFATRYATGNNKTHITQWIADNEDRFKLSLLDGGMHHIAVQFADAARKEVEQSLYEHRFEYEIIN